VNQVKHAVPFAISSDDGITPLYQPVPVEPHKFMPGVAKGNVVPPYRETIVF